MTETVTIVVSAAERRALVESDYKRPVREAHGFRWWAVEPVQVLMSGAGLVRAHIESTPIAA